jgi:DNA repair protein RadD
MNRTLYPHQTEGLTRVRAAMLEGHTRIIMQAPTGAGKTIMAAHLVKDLIDNGMRVIFCVSSLSLIDQTIERFRSEGILDLGVIQGAHQLSNHLATVQICSIQTLRRRQTPRCDFVIIDEVHVWHDAYEEWLADPEWASVPFVGLSATPWRKGLGKFFKKLIRVSSSQSLIDAGFLSPFRVFAPAHLAELSSIKTVAGDYHKGQLSEIMKRPALVADIVETYQKLGEDRSGFCFCVDRTHAKAVQMQFQAHGIPCGYIDCFSKPDERELTRKAFHAGGLKIVCNVGVLTVGIDWDVRIIILARPTKSEMLFVQIVGRGLRTAPGKNDCLILDHSDNHSRLGFVTDINYDDLDDGDVSLRPERKGDGPLPKECPSCHFLRPPKVHACPACGFAPEPKNTIVCEDGELIEIRRREIADTLAQAAFVGMMKTYADGKGYASGWIAHKFREKFGFWPNDPKIRDAPAMALTPEVAAWIRSRQIAFAKARRANG